MYSIEDYSNVKAEIVMITPQMAKEMLSRNYDNRNVNQQNVQKLAKSIKAGTWEVNNQGIGFSTDGTLKDGQHRLMAIVSANIPAPLLVVTGLKTNIGMVDRGNTRSIANSLQMRGTSKDIATKKAVSMIKCLYTICGVPHATEDEVKTILDAYPEIVRKSLTIVRKGANRSICEKSAVYASAFCALYAGVSENTLERFFECVNSGFVSGDHETSAIVLRNYLLQATVGHSSSYMLAPILTQCTRAIQDFGNGKSRRMSYTGEPVYFRRVKEEVMRR